VAPPDTAGSNFPAAEAPSFTTLKAAPLPVPALVVSSDDDPYCTPQAARRLAAGWSAGHVSAGQAGHINTASGVGAWETGRALLAAFLAGLGHPDR
jgi:predicted alpha/beta hydrolase family esterase